MEDNWLKGSRIQQELAAIIKLTYSLYSIMVVFMFVAMILGVETKSKTIFYVKRKKGYDLWVTL